MDPISLTAGLAALVNAGTAVSKEIRAWRDGKRQGLELAADRTGRLHSLNHHGSALAAPQALVPVYAVPATLVGRFAPADDVTARRLYGGHEALVLMWPSGGDPAYDSLVFTCALGGVFSVQFPGGVYDIAAYVPDQRRDEFLGAGGVGPLNLPWNTRTDLTLIVTASEEQYVSDSLTGQYGETVAEPIMPDGVRLPLHWETVIGRSPEANLVLPDHAVAPRHAIIRFADGRYTVFDFGYGMWVNGHCVHTWTLNHGDLITVASWELEFRYRYAS